jgi:hypothetical protein
MSVVDLLLLITYSARSCKMQNISRSVGKKPATQCLIRVRTHTLPYSAKQWRFFLEEQLCLVSRGCDTYESFRSARKCCDCGDLGAHSARAKRTWGHWSVVVVVVALTARLVRDGVRFSIWKSAGDTCVAEHSSKRFIQRLSIVHRTISRARTFSKTNCGVPIFLLITKCP